MLVPNIFFSLGFYSGETLYEQSTYKGIEVYNTFLNKSFKGKVEQRKENQVSMGMLT